MSKPSRTAKDYAIEHAGYLADAAKHLLDKQNEVWALEEQDVASPERLANDNYSIDLDEANERLSDARSALREAVYEFEKRRDRAVNEEGRR